MNSKYKFVLDSISTEGWTSEANEMQASLVRHLRAEGIDDDKIYSILIKIVNDLDRLRKKLKVE